MDLNAIYEEILERLATIPGLRVGKVNAESITVPAVVPQTPRSVTFDPTYGGASAGGRAELVLTVVASEVVKRASVDLMLELTSTTGERSLKAVLEAEPYETVSDLTVTSAENFGAMNFGGIEYLAADLIIQIIT